MIPGSKLFLKRVLSADYNSNVEEKEPEKPKSLNSFLQFRKEMMKTKIGRKYNNLPPQEGLYEADQEDLEEKQKMANAGEMHQNLDFRILDFEADLRKAKDVKVANLENDDEVFEEMEKIIQKEKGDFFKKESLTYSSQNNIFDHDTEKTHKAHYIEEESFKKMEKRKKYLILEKNPETGKKMDLDEWDQSLLGKDEIQMSEDNESYQKLKEEFYRSVILKQEDFGDHEPDKERYGSRSLRKSRKKNSAEGKKE